MSDLISRQQAVDALADMHCKSDEDGYVWIIRSDAWARIDALPSAQPKMCEDAVSKVDVLETYADLYDEFDDYKELQRKLDKVYDKLRDLPSVTPERKMGKWKRAYLDHEAMGKRPSILYCSVCNQCIAYPVNYCPNCGARMEGEG